jgi:hypothetical protein
MILSVPWYMLNGLEHRRSWHGLTTPLFSNFLFTNIFSIKFLYFFIISSLFPDFNLFVSIFIQSYGNNNLHILTLYSMQIVVNTRLYEYWHKQVKIRKKRWNNKEIKKCYWKYICKQKVRKKGGCKSMPRAPVF